MKVSYDKKTVTLSVVLKDHTPIAESDEDKAGVILGYDAVGQPCLNRDPGRFQATD